MTNSIIKDLEREINALKRKVSYLNYELNETSQRLEIAREANRNLAKTNEALKEKIKVQTK